MSNKSRIPSPARSHGAITPRRYRPRSSRSVGSPARSTTSIRLSTIVNDVLELSPMLRRKSVLNDDTDIKVPGRKSWWKNLGENSREVLDVVQNKDMVDTLNVMEDLDVEVLSQGTKNHSLDLQDSSDAESIRSIVIPHRKLFPVKENAAQQNFKDIVKALNETDTDKSSVESDKDIRIAPKNLFRQEEKRPKPVFPAALLSISVNKTVTDKTLVEPKIQSRNLFGNRPAAKRKFADFIVSDSEDEIPYIKPKIFSLIRPSLQKQRSSSISKHNTTTSSIPDIEMDEWKLLPSSTMMEHQFEDQTTPKQSRLSKQSGVHEKLKTIDLENSKTGNQTVNRSNLTKKCASNESFNKTLENEVEKSKQNNESVGNVSKPAARDLSKSNKQNANEACNIERIFEPNLEDNENKDAQYESSDDELENSQLRYEEDEDKNEDIGNEILEKSYKKTDNTLGDPNKTAIEVNISNQIYKKNTSQNVHQIIQDKICEISISEEQKCLQKNCQQSGNRSIQEEKRVNFRQETNDSPKTYGKALPTKENSDLKENNANIRVEQNEDGDVEQNIEVEQCEVQQKYNNSEVEQKESENEQEQSQLEQEESQLEQEQSQLNQEEEISESEQACKSVESELDDTDTEVENKTEEQHLMDVNQDDEINDHDEKQNENVINDNSKENYEPYEEISNSIHDKRNKNENVKSRDVILKNKSVSKKSLIEVEGRNTNVRNSKSVILKNLDLRPSLDKIRESIEFSDGTKDSCANNSGWDSHRTTRKTMRHTFGKDFTPSKSLRTLVMEKSAKRQTYLNDYEEISKIPQANSTEYPEIGSIAEHASKDGAKIHVEESVIEKYPEFESIAEHVSDIEKDPGLVCIDEHASEDAAELDDADSDTEKDPGLDCIDEHASEDAAELDVADSDTENDPGLECIDEHASEDVEDSDTEEDPGIECVDEHASEDAAELDVEGSDTENDPGIECIDEHASEDAAELDVLDSDTENDTRLECTDEHASEDAAEMDIEDSNTEKYPEVESFAEHASENAAEMYLEESIADKSDHEISKRTRQTTLEMYLQKIKSNNVEEKHKRREQIKNSLEAEYKSQNTNPFKIRQAANKKPVKTNSKAKAKPLHHLIPLDTLPEEFLEDMKYKPPKRYKPRNASWVTKRLYTFLETKLEPKYDYKARVRAEKLVETIYQFTRDIRRHEVAPQHLVDSLKLEMARLQIVNTHFEFYDFIKTYLPRMVRQMVVPSVSNKIPLPKPNVFAVIMPM